MVRSDPVDMWKHAIAQQVYSSRIEEFDARTGAQHRVEYDRDPGLR